MAKKPTKTAAKKPAARKTATVKARPDPQSGMDPTSDTDEARERTAAQFKAADAHGKPRTEKEQSAVDEATLSRQIRGY